MYIYEQDYGLPLWQCGLRRCHCLSALPGRYCVNSLFILRIYSLPSFNHCAFSSTGIYWLAEY